MNMEVIAIIERGSDGFYSIYSEQEIDGYGFGGYGPSVEAAQADFMLSIEEAKRMIEAETGRVPDEFTGLHVSYRKQRVLNRHLHAVLD